MSIKLDREALQNIKDYKYTTNGLTFIERNCYEYFWNGIVKFLPKVTIWLKALILYRIWHPT